MRSRCATAASVCAAETSATTAYTRRRPVAGAAPATGRLRVYATVIDLSGHGLDDAPADVDRDQLA